MKLVVGAGPLFPMPQQKMGSAYTTAPMVTVSDTLQQSEYATDPELWDILDSSDDEALDKLEEEAPPSGFQVAPAEVPER